MGGDDIRQARAAARDAQIAETADLRMSQSTSTTRLPEEASVMARLTATWSCPPQEQRGDQDGLAAAGGRKELRLVRRDL